METLATYFENPSLEESTIDKVYIIVGIEFGNREVHILIVSKEVYDLQSYGLRWNERFAHCLRYMGLFICKLEPDI